MKVYKTNTFNEGVKVIKQIIDFHDGITGKAVAFLYELGKTQEEIAEKLEIDRATVASKWPKGKTGERK